MKFPMIVFKDKDSDYCGYMPDFPNMFLAEKTLEELILSVQDAVEVWMEGQEPESFPSPTPLQQVTEMEEAKGRVIALADVDPGFLDAATVRISVSVPRYALSMIDRAAKRAGKKRSAFLVEHALSAAMA